MSNKSSAPSPVSDALRTAGFIPLPRLWVKPEDIPKIHEIAHVHANKVNSIRNRVQQVDSKSAAQTDAAWDEHDKVKGLS